MVYRLGALCYRTQWVRVHITRVFGSMTRATSAHVYATVATYELIYLNSKIAHYIYTFDTEEISNACNMLEINSIIPQLQYNTVVSIRYCNITHPTNKT